MFLCSVTLMLEGTAIGWDRYEHMPRAAAVAAGASLGTLAWSRYVGGGFGGVWWALVVFFAGRLVQHVYHYWAMGAASPFYEAEAGVSVPAAA